MRWAAALLAPLSLLTSICAGAERLTVRQAIETARPMTDERLNAVFVAPGGKQYALMLVRGDVERDGVWAEIYHGRLESIRQARPTLIGRFFTRGLGSPDSLHGEILGAPLLTAPTANTLKWLDDQHVAFLWEDERGINQIVAVSVVDREVRYLTREDRHVMAFAIGPQRSLVYDVARAVERQTSLQKIHEGFAVTSQELLPLLSGIVDESGVVDAGMCERYTKADALSSAGSMHVRGGHVFCQVSFLAYLGKASGSLFSPDGKRVVLSFDLDAVPEEWHTYDHADLQRVFREHARSRSHLRSRLVTQLAIIDLAGGTLRPLWDVPFFSVQEVPLPHLAWSPDGRRLLTGPTFVPVDDRMDDAGRKGLAVVDIDVTSGQYTRVPITADAAREIDSLTWQSDRRIEVCLSDGSCEFFEKNANQWRPGRADRKKEAIEAAMPIQVRIQQDMNTPPALHAVDLRTGERRVIFDLNPQLANLAARIKVEMVHWTTPSGRRWRGRLYLPVVRDDERRFPLVIQTHGYAPENQFSIYGQGDIDGVPLGPGWSVYLASILADHGIAVIQIGGPDPGTGSSAETARWARRYEAFVEGVETLVRDLSERDVIDPHKVGLMGHSATGRYVEYALVHSSLVFAAAIASDYADNNYLQAAVYGWPEDNGIGARAFGDGLQMWLENAPAFNVERIQTPFMMAVTSSAGGLSSLIWGWEMFSRLRRLERPVEYYVIPDLPHGSHVLQNPRQLLALQTRALDWWRFWLLGEEDRNDPSKRQQYESWNALKRKHQADRLKGRAPLRRWEAHGVRLPEDPRGAR